MVSTRAAVHIIEPHAEGHRMQYVRRLLEALPEGQTAALSTFPSSLEHPSFVKVREVSGARLQVHCMAGEMDFKARVKGKDGFGLHPAYWSLFRRHWRSLSPEARGTRVMVPYLDYCSYGIGAAGSPFGSTPFEGILMRPDFHWDEMGVKAPPSKLAWLKRFLILRLMKNPTAQRLVTIDPSLRDWVAKHMPAGHERVEYMEDPSDMKGEGGPEEGRAYFGVPEGKKVILLFGAIDPRKGLKRLLGLLKDPGTEPEILALVVGRQTEAAKEMIDSANLPEGRMISWNRYVDAQEEWLAFQAADWIWLAYEGFYGPSGVLAQARQVGKPVIHIGEGLLGYSEMPSSFWIRNAG